MSIRLTESRLRQIIREETAKLARHPARRLREGAAGSATHFIDIDVVDDMGFLNSAFVNEDLTEEVDTFLDPSLAGVSELVTLASKRGPSGHPVVRFHGTMSEMQEVARLLGELGFDPAETTIERITGY